MRLIAVLAAVFFATSAHANGDGPNGIGFAQAEEGTWWCNAAAASDALNCAREKCVAEAGGQECVETAWCFPAGWSGLLTVWLTDFHTTEVLCGAPAEASLADTFRAWCAASEGTTHCDFFTSIDPDGNASEVEGQSFPGAAAP